MKEGEGLIQTTQERWLWLLKHAMQYVDLHKDSFKEKTMLRQLYEEIEKYEFR